MEIRRVIFLVFVLCTVTIIAEDVKVAEVVEKLINVIKVGAECGNGIKNIEVENTLNSHIDVAKQMLDLVATALGPYGAILSATSSLLVLFKEMEPTDKQVMLEQFQQTHLRFDAIQHELEEMKHLIGEIPEKVELHARISEIEVLMLASQRWQRSPLTESSDFLIACNENAPEGTLDYIYIHRNGIKNSVARHYDRVAVLKMMQTLGIIQINALKMYELCQGVKSVDLPAEQRNQYVNGKKRNVEDFRRNIETVMQVFYDIENHIVRKFFTEYAKSEIDAFVKEHINFSNYDIAKKLQEMLTKKYYWRKFGVGVYSGKTEDGEHSYETDPDHAHRRFDVDGRSWYVLMTREFSNQNDKEKFKSAARGCIKQFHIYGNLYLSNARCKIVHNDHYLDFHGLELFRHYSMVGCMAPHGFVNIACVQEGNDLNWFVDKDDQFGSERQHLALLIS